MADIDLKLDQADYLCPGSSRKIRSCTLKAITESACRVQILPEKAFSNSIFLAQKSGASKRSKIGEKEEVWIFDVLRDI